jgi:hypothetical protein
MTTKEKKAPRSRNRKRTKSTNEAHLRQLRMHASIRAMIKAQGYAQIGDKKCTTVGEALTALGR